MSDKAGHARLPSERGMEKIVRVLLYTGHLPVSSVKALRGACKSLKATIAEHLPRTFLYDVRLEDHQAPVRQIEALRVAWGCDKVRRACMEAAYIPFLPLLTELEALEVRPDYDDVEGNMIDVEPLCLMALKKLEVDGRSCQPLSVLSLASLTTLSSLSFSDARAEANMLPASIVDLTFAEPDLDYASDLPVLATLNSFVGQLLSLCLDTTAMQALHFGLSDVSAVPSLSGLTHLTLSVLGQQEYELGVTHACFPGLQTLNLVMFTDEVPAWDFNLCPVLRHLGLDVGLTHLTNNSTLHLTRLTGLRARQLALELECVHVLHVESNFANWGLETASIIVTDNESNMVPCRGCRVGRELLGSLLLELPRHMVQEDTIFL